MLAMCVSQAGLSVNGTHVRTLVLRKKGNTGLAISPDGTVMVISNVEVHVVSVYGLPDGVWKAEFGGEGSGPAQFKRPFKLCFSTLSGNILVTDAGNRRVQVCSLWHVLCLLSFPSVCLLPCRR